MSFEIINGDCLIKMAEMPANSIDFIVTDPPYGLHFMGKDWDKFNKSNFNESGDWNKAIEKGKERNVRKIATGNSHAGTYDEKRNDEFEEFITQFGIEALRIIKPGGHIAMFGAPRRHHRQMSGLEDAGFEIRDCIMWIYGSGFPKSHNFGRKLGGEWMPYGSALKPAYEPIILAMKPLEGTFIQNAEKWGVAGINIDQSRVEGSISSTVQGQSSKQGEIYGKDQRTMKIFEPSPHGRWPANLIFNEEAASELDQQSGNLVSKWGKQGKKQPKSMFFNEHQKDILKSTENFIGDSGGASRFFYCAKASSKERTKENKHPTVKPLALMKYVLTMLCPPGNPVVLDPFMGSGTTLVAAKELGIRSIGIEMSEDYCTIAHGRLKSVEKDEPKEESQLRMFA